MLAAANYNSRPCSLAAVKPTSCFAIDSALHHQHEYEITASTCPPTSNKPLMGWPVFSVIAYRCITLKIPLRSTVPALVPPPSTQAPDGVRCRGAVFIDAHSLQLNVALFVLGSGLYWRSTRPAKALQRKDR